VWSRLVAVIAAAGVLTAVTMSVLVPEVQAALDAHHADPVRIDLAPLSRPVSGITQAIYPVPRPLKTDLLDEMLSRTELRSVIVFARTKRGADRLTRQLQRRGHSVAVIHGNRSQSQRERALRDLKRGRVQIMVATDIASRGIDVDDISHVINFDVPHTPEDYVHRIGRTGRIGAAGDAFTLMSQEEHQDVAAIERFLGRSIPRVMLPDFNYKMKPTEFKQAMSEAPSTGDRGGRHGGRDRHAGHAVAAAPAPSGPSHGRRTRPARAGERRGRGRM